MSPASKTTRIRPTSTRRTRLIHSHSRPRAEAGRGRAALLSMTHLPPRPRSFLPAPGRGEDPRPRRLHVSKHTGPRAGAPHPSGLHPNILLDGLPRILVPRTWVNKDK